MGRYFGDIRNRRGSLKTLLCLRKLACLHHLALCQLGLPLLSASCAAIWSAFRLLSCSITKSLNRSVYISNSLGPGHVSTFIWSISMTILSPISISKYFRTTFRRGVGETSGANSISQHFTKHRYRAADLTSFSMSIKDFIAVPFTSFNAPLAAAILRRTGHSNSETE